MLSSDFHVHTSLSPCGAWEATPTVMVKAAQERGLETIGFADHFAPRPTLACPFYDRQGRRVLDELRAELATIEAGLDILVGVEVDYTVFGERCVAPDNLSLVDFVIVAASHFHLPGTLQPRSKKPRAIAEHVLDHARAAVLLPGVTILAHPFSCSTLLPLAPLTETLTDGELAGLAELARDHQVALEINAGAASNKAYREGATRFFKLARGVGARFTLASDAHHPADYDCLEVAVAWARQMGFSEDDFLTADELRNWHTAKLRSAG